MIISIILLGLILFIVYNSIILVSKSSISSPLVSKELDGFKILLISDIHGRKFKLGYKNLVSKIREQSPDIIIISGDLMNKNQSIEPTKQFLTDLTGICEVYLGIGNHEMEFTDELLSEYLRTAYKLGVHVLMNENCKIKHNNAEIIISGITLRPENYKYKERKRKYKNLLPYRVQDVKRALGKKKSDKFTVMIAHNPLFFEAYSEWGADLVLSGHVHGGLITVPFIGGLLSPERKLFPKYWSGKYTRGSSTMVVSKGLVHLRLFQFHEINLITLKSSN